MPFWANAYSKAQLFTFEKDLSFLIFHGVQVRERQSSAELLICDFSFFQDLAYARLSQTAAELAAYTPVHAHTVTVCGEAELIINLRCSTNTLLSRIRQRGRPEEQFLDGLFLERLGCEIDLVLAEKIPRRVIEIDSEAIDFRKVLEVTTRIVPMLGLPFSSLIQS